MKKVSLIRLNIQQESILSKDEKRRILGGYTMCYVVCTNGGMHVASSGMCTPYDQNNLCGGGGSGGSFQYCLCDGTVVK